MRACMSMKELAEQLDIHYSHLSDLELHKQHFIRKLDVDKISKILGVPVSEIFEVVT